MYLERYTYTNEAIITKVGLRLKANGTICRPNVVKAKSETMNFIIILSYSK